MSRCCRKNPEGKEDANCSSPQLLPKANTKKDPEYVKNLECQFACMQQAFIHLSTRFAQLQFYVRKLLQAPEQQDSLKTELEEIANGRLTEHDCENMTCKEYELISMQKDVSGFGAVECKQSGIVDTLRGRLMPLDLIELEVDNEYCMAIESAAQADEPDECNEEKTCCCGSTSKKKNNDKRTDETENVEEKPEASDKLAQ